MKKNLFHRFLLIASFILLVSLCALPAFAAGEVDTSFHASLVIAPQGTITQTLVQPDGKILIAGKFTVAGGYSFAHIARLNPNGSIDLTFNPVVLGTSQWDDIPVRKLGFQSNGKIIVGGAFTINGFTRAIIRLNPDGSHDTSFVDPFGQNDLRTVRDFAIAPDDKIVYAGQRPVGQFLGRLNADGTPDGQIQVNIGTLALQPDGKIIAYNSASFTIDRYNPNFTIDNTFQSPFVSHAVIDIAVQADGKIILGGALTAVNNFAISRIARLNANGTIDPTFNIGTAGPDKSVNVIEILADGKILIGGEFNNFNGTPANYVARLNPSNGSLDTTFTSGITGLYIAYDLDIQPDGKIIVAGVPVNETAVYMYRLNPNGTVDSSFTSPTVGNPGFASKVLVQPDNKILVGGFFTAANEKVVKHLVRFNADGTVDNTFNVTTPYIYGTVHSIALQADGKILVTGETIGGAVRLNADGSFDTLFFTQNVAHDVKILPDGKVLLTGTGYVLRFNADGTPDNTFNTVGTNNRNRKLAVQPDGKFFVVGDFNQVNNQPRGFIARLNADGTLDATFNPPGGANGAIYDVVIQPDGKVLIGGDFTGVNFDTTRKYLARLDADGSLDTAFAPVLTTKVRTIRLQPNGKILVGGIAETVSAPPVPGKVHRLNADGSFDATFNNSIVIDQSVNSIDLQSDGKIILGGLFRRVGGVANLGVARLFNASNSPFDFDGDGRTDISIFRPSVGEWWYYRSIDGGNYAAQFGASNDKLVPGDYTGDGRTDFAVWRPSTGEWFILRSEDGSYYSYPFGTGGDIPTVGDFDGDGKADSAVFRPSDTTWYIRRSSDGGFTIQQFGASGDVPVPADYDGDGKDDIAIWRAATGEWWINRSTAGVIVFQFGNNADKPVQGDYTGDGKADVAFWRPSMGEWFIQRSEDFSFYSFPFGTNSDMPAPGDYDGDGRFDATVFRPSESRWYVQRSTAGTIIQDFGTTGDVPVPGAFVPGPLPVPKAKGFGRYRSEMNY